MGPFSTSSGIRAQAWWCHHHGKDSHCFRLQIPTLFRRSQEAAAIHQKSQILYYDTSGDDKIPHLPCIHLPIKTAGLLKSSQMCVSEDIQYAHPSVCVSRLCLWALAEREIRLITLATSKTPQPPKLGGLDGRSEQMPNAFTGADGRRWNHIFACVLSIMHTYTHVIVKMFGKDRQLDIPLWILKMTQKICYRKHLFELILEYASQPSVLFGISMHSLKNVLKCG